MAIYATNTTTVVIANVATASNVIVQNQLAAWAVRYRAYDLSAMIFKNDEVVASGSASALLTDRAAGEFRIGRSHSGWGTPVNMNGSLQAVYIYDRSLGDEEISNLCTHKFGAIFGAVRAYSLKKIIPTYAGPVVRVRRSTDSLEQSFWAETTTSTLSSSALSKRWTDLDASSRTLAGTDVTSWGTPVAFTASGATAPEYVAADDVVRFTRANSDFLTAGSRTLSISTNGGFTVVIMARYSGSAGSNERLLDWGSGATSDNVIFGRATTTSNLVFQVYNGSTSVVSLTATGAIVQNELAIFVARYTASTNSAEIYKNMELIASAVSLAAVANRTVTNTYIGRSNTGADAYYNGDIRGVYACDYSLSLTDIQSVVLSKFGTAGVTGSEFDTFVGAGTGYISALFDQTGQKYHATQATAASQPYVVKNATWTSQPTMRFGGVGFLGYDCATNGLVNTDYSVAVTTARTSSASSNFFLSGTSTTTNQNLIVGFGSNTTFTHGQWGNNYDSTVPGYTAPTAETFVVRHSSTFAKNAYKNGTLLGSNASTVALGAYAGAQIGKYQTGTLYNGDITSIVMFDTYLSDRRRQIVEADLASLAI